MVEVLKLKKRYQSASGTQRKVYLHPNDPTRLIKVLRPMPKTEGRAKLATRMERYFPYFRRRWTRKEYTEYLRLMLSYSGDPIAPPIAHMYGFVMTSKGLGCLSDAVLEDGALGQTLLDKMRRGTLSTDDLALFNDTIARLYHYDIRAGDMTARNFVFGQRNVSGQLGPRECVLVDGFGDIHAIPIRSWGRVFNRFGLDDSCKRLAQRTGLRWHPATRQFSMKE
ncbi:MAG: YrbL family protein [Pseudomonadota bacterium]